MAEASASFWPSTRQCTRFDAAGTAAPADGLVRRTNEVRRGVDQAPAGARPHRAVGRGGGKAQSARILDSSLEDGLFPHFNSLDDPHAVEEERRLFYVGMTRARKRLICSYAHMRRRMGVVEGGTPSRFLYEIPEEFLEGRIEDTGGLGFARQGTTADFEDISQEELAYSIGMKIRHDDFGRGIVRRVEGSGENLRVTVLFDGGGERKFLAQYAPMHPL